MNEPSRETSRLVHVPSVTVKSIWRVRPRGVVTSQAPSRGGGETEAGLCACATPAGKQLSAMDTRAMTVYAGRSGIHGTLGHPRSMKVCEEFLAGMAGDAERKRAEPS